METEPNSNMFQQNCSKNLYEIIVGATVSYMIVVNSIGNVSGYLKRTGAEMGHLQSPLVLYKFYY